MARGKCIYCGYGAYLKKDGTLKKHKIESEYCPGGDFKEFGINAVKEFIKKHEDIALSAENQEVRKAHQKIADEVASRYHDLLKTHFSNVDLKPYFQKKLGEHFKTVQEILDMENRRHIWRLFDVEVIATDEKGVWFEVWSFSFSEFYDDAKYHDDQYHGRAFVSFARCTSVQHFLGVLTSQYTDHKGLKRGSHIGPFLANR